MTEFVHDNLEYEIDEWGNVRSMSIYYEKEMKKYVVSMSVYEGFSDSERCINLEITKQSNNPLSNILGDNVLASSKTPFRLWDINTASVWQKICYNEIVFPQDERFHEFLNLALSDIKKQAPEIEKNIILMVRERKKREAKYNAYKKQSEERELSRLKKKSNQFDIDLIQSITYERK